MDFLSHDIIVDSLHGPLHVRITGEAISHLWGTQPSSVGAAHVVDAYRPLLAELAIQKLQNHQYGESGLVEITAEDMESRLNGSLAVTEPSVIGDPN